MAEIKQYPKDRIVMIEISEDELDKLLEIAIVRKLTLSEVIIACLQIGIIKCIAQNMRDQLET